MFKQMPSPEKNTADTQHLFTKQYVAGIADALTVLFTFCFALSVLYVESKTILGIGATASILLWLILGVGSFFAAKNSQKDLLKKTSEEEKKVRELELNKTIQLFTKLNLGKDMQELAADAFTKDEASWKNFLEQQQQTLEEPSKSQPFKSTIATVMAAITGTCVAMAPWVFFSTANNAMKVSLLVCLPMLFAAGFLKSKVNGEPTWWGGLRQLLLGASLALAGYLIANIFK